VPTIVVWLMFLVASVWGIPENIRLLVQQNNRVEAQREIFRTLPKVTHEQREGLMLLLIDSYLHLEQPDSALTYIQMFRNTFTSGRYSEDLLLYEAQALLLRSDFLPSARILQRLMERTNTESMYNQTQDLMRRLIQEDALGTRELWLLSNETTSLELQGHLWYNLARNFYQEKKYKASLHYLVHLQKTIPNHSLAERAAQMESRMRPLGPGAPVILLVAPFSGEQSFLGTEALQGATLALEQSPYKDHIQLELVDTRGDAVYTLAELGRMMEMHNVVGVIGPLLSGTSIATAQFMRNFPDIAMITPTATDSGIGSIGTNVFQINVPTSLQSEVLVDRIAQCKGDQGIAVIAQNSMYGRQVANHFVERSAVAGLNIAGVDFYDRNIRELQPLFYSYRVRYYIDWERRSQLWGPLRGADSAQQARIRTSWLADTLIQNKNFFMVAEDPQQAGTLLRQLSFQNIRGQIYGSAGWYGNALLTEHRQYAEGAIIVVPFLEMPDAKWQSAFRARWEALPESDLVPGLSYDAMTWFLSQFHPNRNPGQILQRLRSNLSFRGVKGEYKINQLSGINEQVHILKVRGGRFVPVVHCMDF
jgi:ABC-type branched-subunit amino acid transport system substrate-binding protein